MQTRIVPFAVVLFSAGLLHAAPHHRLGGRLGGHAETASRAPVGAAPRETPLPADRGDGVLALAALDRKIADLDAEEATTKKGLSATTEQLSATRAKDLARGRSFYKLTRAGLLPLSFGFESLVRHATRVERQKRLLASGLAEEEALRAHSASLASALERVSRDRAALASQRSAMDAARMALAEEGRREKAFADAFAATGGGGEFVAVHSGPGEDDAHETRGFSAARGRLLFPIAEAPRNVGDARPAKRDDANGPGLEITSKLGATVRAVYGGRVAFADRYGGYGRIVILDHGDHYYTVSGNLGSIDVKVGDEVGAGEKVGTVGDEGAGPLLYFEVRHGSATVPPAEWLGL